MIDRLIGALHHIISSTAATRGERCSTDSPCRGCVVAGIVVRSQLHVGVGRVPSLVVGREAPHLAKQRLLNKIQLLYGFFCVMEGRRNLQ